MKRLLFLAIALLVFSTPAAARQIGVIGEFPNRRPPSDKLKGVSVAAGDVNGDGIAEIAVMQGGTLHVFDPASQSPLLSFDIEEALKGISGDGVDQDDVVTLIGFVDFSSEPHAVIAVEKVERGIIAILIGVVSNEVAYAAEERVVAILESPGGQPVILTYIEQGNVYKLVGELPGSAPGDVHDEPEARYASSRRGTYRLDLKLQAAPGQRLAYDPNLFDPPGDTDLNDDGHLDVPILMVENGQVAGLVVRGGNDLKVLWHFAFPDEHRENILKGFHGFADADGDGEKEAFFGENLAVTLDGTVHVLADGFVTLDVNDVDTDGYEDIIGLNTADSTIVVYGAREAATSVRDNGPAAIRAFLFQNYPNPFRETTAITYEVEQPGPVTVTVYDVLGRRVRTLVDGVQPAGPHRVVWDGRDGGGQPVAAGTYFYRLRVGDVVASRHALHVK